MARFVHRAAVALLAAAVAWPVLAQDDAGRASREREALRRVQAALRQSQAQEAQLAGEKSTLASERDKLRGTAVRAESQLAGARSETARLRAEVDHNTIELAAMRAQLEADKKKSQDRIDELARRLDTATQQAADRGRTVAALTALLERSTTALAAAEKSNRAMHAWGLQLIEQVRSGSGVGAFTGSDPVLGFGQVRIENSAEAMRDGLDALRINRPK